jgi:Flp pilus assembly secretin CpaC
MKHFVRSTLVALTLFCVPAFAGSSEKSAPAASEERLTVRAGNAKTLNAPGVTRLALGDPEIADVKMAGGDVIRIEGLKAGETMLIVWVGKARKSYRIVVEG